MKIVITGADGQLAAELRRALATDHVVALGRAELDITNASDIERVFRREAPDVVVNTAAFHRVDRCEDQPEEAFLVNAVAPQRLARACHAAGAMLVHFSTDYVFDGRQTTPYRETDPVNPLNVYGASKAAGEMAIRCSTPRHLIVRTTGVFGVAGAASRHGNFVETMLRLAARDEPVSVVADQVLSPTYAFDLAETVRALLERSAYGTVHVTGGGQCSWYELAAAVFRRAGSDTTLLPVSQDERPVPARRPAYSVLAHDRLRQLGIPEPRHWEEGLEAYLTERAKLLPAHEA